MLKPTTTIEATRVEKQRSGNSIDPKTIEKQKVEVSLKYAALKAAMNLRWSPHNQTVINK
jgi:hypothetical protein